MIDRTRALAVTISHFLFALNAPELLTFLRGPETDEQVEKRHAKYVASSTGSTPNQMFSIRLDGERAVTRRARAETVTT